ncbi:uncharacterized protein V1510DRAFT_167035 [Dipodascopsis tothii]|uniref:uncharacterized protein n=1 Tax=Dipodascopsis tothii TaxID=44089 RepID=UPI0034CF0A93
MSSLRALRPFSTASRALAKTRVPSLGNVPPHDDGHYFSPTRYPAPPPATESQASDVMPSSDAKSGLIKSILYGSDQSKKEQAAAERSYSNQLSRGKYVHEMVVHKVRPDRAPDYVDLVSQVYPRIAATGPLDDSSHKVHLVGSWRTVIGDDLDTYVHIWEYSSFAGFHDVNFHLHNHEPFFLDYIEKVRPMLVSRKSDLMQEFDFWGGTAAPHDLGGIFELRSYNLKAGQLLNWETSWKRGLECRRQVMEPVGAWFNQLGEINTVHHLWQFADLEHRKSCRDKCWHLPGWANTVHETVGLVNRMQSHVLVALPFSPLK